METGTDCYILTQSSSDHCSTSFSFWLGCSTVGHWGPQALSLQADSHAGILSPNWLQLQLELNWNWLTQAVWGTWLYNCLTPTCFLWAYASTPNSTTSTGQGDIPIPSTGCTCFTFFRLFTLVHLLIDDSVEGQYRALKLIFLTRREEKAGVGEIISQNIR